MTIGKKVISDKYGKVEYIDYIIPDITPEEIAKRQKEQLLQQLAATDSGIIRIIEDLLLILQAKGVILNTDIPVSVQQKLQARQALRAQISTI